jgi:hypothetical protein
MILWFVFAWVYNTNATVFGNYGWFGNSLLLFILLFLLGWHNFGFVIHQ